MRSIRDSSLNLLRFVNDIFDLYKIETGSMEIFSDVFGPADLLRDLVKEMEPAMAAAGNVVELDVPDDIGLVSSDMRKIRIILVQLRFDCLRDRTRGSHRLSIVVGRLQIFLRLLGRSSLSSLLLLLQLGHGRRNIVVVVRISRIIVVIKSTKSILVVVVIVIITPVRPLRTPLLPSPLFLRLPFLFPTIFPRARAVALPLTVGIADPQLLSEIAR